MDMERSVVPKGLRMWFVIHFVADMIFAIPLILLPEKFISFLGWSVVDPITPRLVGAALLGIGIESLLAKNANREVFTSMLNLKIIWSSGAILAFALGIVSGGPPSAWILLIIFMIFWGIWIYYWIRLRRKNPGQ
jgi:hypothetical protein